MTGRKKPAITPIYDETFAKGAAWIDSLAGEPPTVDQVSDAPRLAAKENEVSETMAPGEERDDVRCTIESEGFDYAYRSHSSFERVKDPRFHELRLAYIAAAEALDAYVGSDDE